MRSEHYTESAISTVFMFSGQGSQYYKMGEGLFTENSVFRQHLLTLDEISKDYVDISVVDTIFSPNKHIIDPLDDPIISGISLLLIELALVKTLIDQNIQPDILIGSSFGTFIASVAAGCIDEEAAISAFVMHGDLFAKTCENGNMLNVLSSPDVFYKSQLLQHVADLAGINFSNSFVLSLPETNLKEVELFLSSHKHAYQKIPVKTAYHSRWIDSARNYFFDLYSPILFDKPTIPIICTQKTNSLTELTAEALWDVVRKPIRFLETIKALENGEGQYRYIDVGPSSNLATSLKYALGNATTSRIFFILSPFRKRITKQELLLSII